MTLGRRLGLLLPRPHRWIHLRCWIVGWPPWTGHCISGQIARGFEVADGGSATGFPRAMAFAVADLAAEVFDDPKPNHNPVISLIFYQNDRKDVGDSNGDILGSWTNPVCLTAVAQPAIVIADEVKDFEQIYPRHDPNSRSLMILPG